MYADKKLRFFGFFLDQLVIANQSEYMPSAINIIWQDKPQNFNLLLNRHEDAKCLHCIIKSLPSRNELHVCAKLEINFFAQNKVFFWQ